MAEVRSRGFWIEVDKGDLRDIQALLDTMGPKDSKRFMAKATAEGAKYLKPKVVAATPLGPGHFGIHLKKRVSAGAAKKEKPAGIVKYRAGYTHMVMGGTRAHRIRFPDQKAAGVPKEQGNILHPGAKANPIIDKVADQHGGEALDRSIKYLVRAFGLDE